jgi:hypothetical protein
VAVKLWNNQRHNNLTTRQHRERCRLALSPRSFRLALRLVKPRLALRLVKPRLALRLVKPRLPPLDPAGAAPLPAGSGAGCGS